MRIYRWWMTMLIIVLCTTEGFSQQLRLGINSAANIKSAVLELQSTNQGLLFTRIADTALINTLNPPDGMVVYFTPAKRLLLRANGAWQSLASTTSIDTTNIPNFYLKVRNELSGGTGINYNNITGVISNAGVTTLNGNTGALTMDTGYIGNFYQKVRGLFGATAPITLSNGQIGITQATASTNGYLSSTDWNTFNNKLSSVDTTNIPGFYLKVRNELSSGTGINYNNVTGVISNAGVTTLNGNTGALTMDTGYISNFYQKVRSEHAAGTGISYNATTGVITNAGVTSLNGSTGALTMDTGYISNFYQKVRSEHAAGTGISYNAVTGVITNAGVTSLNGSTGALTMDTTFISNFYQKVRSLFSAGSGIGYNAATGVITASGAAGSNWSLNGNTAGALKTIGTIDNYDLPIITNNVERMRISNAGNVAIGATSFDVDAPERLLVDAGVNDSYNLLIARGERNGYLQFNIQNNSTGGQASTDIVATANNGTETTNYVNLGINGGGYNSANNILSGPDNGYLFSAGQDFIVGNSATSKSLILFTGGIATSNERMRITSAGKVGIGTTSPATTLDVAGTYKLGSSGTALNNMIKTSFSITDNNAFGLGTTKVITATVTGATTGATVIINPRSQLPTAVAIAYSYVSAANTITIGFICSQAGSATSTLGTITFDVTLIQ
jgi:hypothetical protein